MKQLKVIGASLLTADEVKNIPEDLLCYHAWWWIKSASKYHRWHYVAIIEHSGKLNQMGRAVDFKGIIRPILEIANVKAAGLKTGDHFIYGGKEFCIISDTAAFCVNDIGCCQFRKEYSAKDATEYDASNIKAYINNWLEAAKGAQPVLLKCFDVTMQMNAVYKTKIFACDAAQAKSFAENNFFEADFGEAEDIDGEVICVE